MNDIAIRVDNVTKIYKLYDKSSDRLKEALKLTKEKRYKEHYALDQLNFDIFKGECVGIIGTNGAGKSTILKIITGVLNPTSGSVQVNGRISALLELGAGFNQEYTGIENVYLNGTMIGFTREEIEKKLDTILEFADIGEFIHQPVKTYSSGMFVRLAFAVAINIEPEILIVDEALSVGDVFFQAKCYRKFEEFKEMGKTILFVSHDLGSIAKYCDRVVLLNKGKRMSEGSPKQIVDLYKKVLVGHDNDTNTEEIDVLDPSKKCVEVWKNNYVTNPQLIEYGDRRGEIVDFAVVDKDGILTNTIEKGTEFEIKVKIHFKEEVQNPIFAFTIKDLKGTELTGTNSLFEKIHTGNVKVGEYKTVIFRQKMDLQGGQYLLSLGCTGYDGENFVVYHRLYDLISLGVISQKDTVGCYDMNSQITVM